MNIEEKEIIGRIQNDFLEIEHKKQLNDEDVGALESGITGLLGFYRLKQSRELYALIKEMILLGESRGIDMAAARLLFWKANSAGKKR